MTRRIVGILGIALPLFLLLLDPPLKLPPHGLKILAMVIFAICFFVSEIIPLSVTGLLLLLFFTLSGVVSPSVAFSGFTTPALWLVFAAYLLGGGMLQTGLARRMAFAIVRVFGNRFDRIVQGFCLIGFILNFLIPSGNARVALLIPIALEIQDAFGLKLKSRGSAALILATTLSAFFPGFALLTANVPNLVHIGVIESVGGLNISYGLWAYLHLPVLGIARLVLIYGVVRVFIWPKSPPTLQSDFLSGYSTDRLTLNEKKMIVFLVIAVGLWATDFLHGVKPAWVGLSIALVAMLPRIGVLNEKAMIQHTNFPLLIYLASIFGLGTVLATTGLSEWAAGGIFGFIPLSEMSGAGQVTTVALITLSLAILTTHPAIPAVITPIIIAYGVEHGMDVSMLLMAQVLGLSVGFFPYQMPPMITAQGYGAFSSSQILRVMVPFGIASVILVIPLTILYWTLIGYLP
jgi:anion transporter